ncbi:MAG: hypothetical protein IPP49_15760 [Saprospiraceae bacterium]|nr:hypothetical protein [Saprospiraceae bacterium]
MYTEKEGKVYQTLKQLKKEKQIAFHVKAYEESTSIPEANEIGKLKVQIYHFPIDRKGFNQPKFISNSRVTEDDLLGYFLL